MSRSKRAPAPLRADGVLDVLVRTLGREAQRFEEASEKGPLEKSDIYLLMGMAAAVTKVVEQQSNPFGPAFTARLKQMTDGQLEAARRLLAIDVEETKEP